MVQIGNVPQINEVKAKLNELKREGLVMEWELPYENLLTRLDAAIFFLRPGTQADMDRIWESLRSIPRFKYQANSAKRLSQLEWQVQFNAESDALAKAS